MKQSKEEFIENVRYHAAKLEERLDWLACTARHRVVDIDQELKALFDECERFERLMIEASVRLSRRCREKLEF